MGQVAPERGLGVSEDSTRNTGAGTPRLAAAESVCIAEWPVADVSRQDATIEAQFADFQAVLGAAVRRRQRQNIPFKEELTFVVRCDAATAKLLEPMGPYFQQMAHAAMARLVLQLRARAGRLASNYLASMGRLRSTLM